MVFRGVTVPEQNAADKPISLLGNGTLPLLLIPQSLLTGLKVIDNIATSAGADSLLIDRYPLLLLPPMGTYPVKSGLAPMVPPIVSAAPLRIIC